MHSPGTAIIRHCLSRRRPTQLLENWMGSQESKPSLIPKKLKWHSDKHIHTWPHKWRRGQLWRAFQPGECPPSRCGFARLVVHLCEADLRLCGRLLRWEPQRGPGQGTREGSRAGDQGRVQGGYSGGTWVRDQGRGWGRDPGRQSGQGTRVGTTRSTLCHLHRPAVTLYRAVTGGDLGTVIGCSVRFSLHILWFI